MPASRLDAHNLDAQLDWLFARQRFGVKLGLERVTELLELLGRPQEHFQVVLVGGTNGKGSCSSTLASILAQAGTRTGLFTSPHLTHFGERFLVDGLPLSEVEVAAGLELLRPHAEALGATFFEIVTALACALFARAGVECAVMEVGLGGRFDATNALAPRLSVITGVALDHTEVLGDTVTQIATEKAGIMRPGVPALTGATGAALRVIEGAAAALGTPLTALERGAALSVTSLGWLGVQCAVRGPAGEVVVTSPLLGLHQGRNVALAVLAAQVLGVSLEAIRRGTEQTRWPGRLEPIRFAERTFLLDGAHNPQAADALAAALEQLGAAPTTLIFGASVDKQLAEMAAALEPVAAEVILTRARLSPRAASPTQLQPLWHMPVHLTDSPAEALECALARTQLGATVVVAGSLYLVGELRPLLLGEVREARERQQ